MKLLKNKFFLHLLSFLIFCAATIYITYPLILHLNDFVTGELVISWIMNWDIHKFTTGLQGFFQGNIYYPYHNSLAYSDLFITSSLFALPVYLFFHEPMAPANFTFISSLILVGFGTYLLSFYITKNFLVSLLSGVLIIFSPTFLDHRIHLQVLAVEWIPFSVLSFLHFLKSEKYKYFLLSLFFFLLQTYNSFMPGYFLVFFYLSILIVLLFKDRKKLVSILNIKYIIPVLITAVLLIPIIIPYFQISHEFNYVRDIRDGIHFAIQPEDLIYSASYSRLAPAMTWYSNLWHYPANAEIKPGYIGFVFSILSIFSFFFWLRQKRKNFYLSICLIAALIGLILSFGPALHLGRKTVHIPFIIPLPYALFYYIIPGFQGFRNTARYEVLFLLGIAPAIAVFLTEFLKRFNKKMRNLILSLLIIGAVAEYNFPMQFEKAYTFESFPKVYSWINTNTSKTAVIMELPIYNWDNNPFGDNREVLREYFSTLDFRQRVGGGSGFSPPPWQTFAKNMFNEIPNPKSIAEIKKLGVNNIIVHADEYDNLHERKWPRGNSLVYPSKYILDMLKSNSLLILAKSEGNDYVFKVK